MAGRRTDAGLAGGGAPVVRSGSAPTPQTDARKGTAHDATAMSELAATELATGDYFRAAEHAGAALQADPSQADAAFRFALALDRLALRREAMRAWERYLVLDPSSERADEAREHLVRLGEPRNRWFSDRELLAPGASGATIEAIVRRYPQRSRARSYNILLPRWSASQRPDELAVLRAIGDLHVTLGDPFLHDVVEHAAAHPQQVGPALAAFARAYDAEYGSSPNPAVAESLYAEARRLLDAAGSPLGLVAAIQQASDLTYQGHPDVGLLALDDVELQLAGRYPGIGAEMEWGRGVALTRIGEPQHCLDAYRRGTLLARQAGEVEIDVYLDSLIASELELVGDPDEARRTRVVALRRLDHVDAHPNPYYVAMAETAGALLRAEMPHVAMEFVDDQTRRAIESGSPMLIAEAETQKAQALLLLGNAGAAVMHIDSARARAASIEGPSLRDRTLADIELVAGRVAVERHPSLALDSFTRSIDLADRNGWRMHSAAAHLARGDARAAAGDRGGAELDFRAGIGDMEAQRLDFKEADPRIAYFEHADRLFDRLLSTLVAAGRFDDALTEAERRRSRLLLERRTGDDAARPLDANALRRGVPDGSALLEIVLLEHGAELWLIEGGRVTHARSAAPGAEIEESVGRHLRAIAADDRASIAREGRWLARQLLEPVTSQLPASAGLVIAADGVLQSFPFATLVTLDGNYLVESRTLATAPSGSVWLATPPSAGGRSLVAVAEAAPGGLPLLPHAEEEAVTLARRAGGRALLGAEVTPQQFLALAGSVSAAHFAGHASTDPDRPARSSLLFQNAGGPPSALTAEMIGRSRLRSHPLVVLNACSTARGRVRRNEGVDSLTAAFLQAGARGVVATLWDVDDSSSASLFKSFHQNLRNGARAADALRSAQRQLSRSHDPGESRPAAWGGSIVVGTL